MAHLNRETHYMCRQGVKPVERGRSVSPNAVEPENATSSTEAYFDPILSATMPIVFLKMMPGPEAGKVVSLHSIWRYTTPPLDGFDP